MADKKKIGSYMNLKGTTLPSFKMGKARGRTLFRRHSQ